MSRCLRSRIDGEVDNCEWRVGVTRRYLAAVLLLLGYGFAAGDAAALRLVALQGRVVDATVVTSPPGERTLFVAERAGRIVTLPGSGVFLDIRDRVLSDVAERGLLGVAFHPDYSVNGRFFVNYTDPAGATVIAEYRHSRGSGVVDPAGARQVMRIERTATNHDGGMLAFGPDGYLYIGLGDSGGTGDPLGAAQRLDTHLGKILRIDVESPSNIHQERALLSRQRWLMGFGIGLQPQVQTAEAPYLVPPSNPFVGRSGALPEIYSLGLRNPWRFSFDSRRGDLWVGDVGQSRREEVNWVSRGRARAANFGWNRFEGGKLFNSTTRLRVGRVVQPVAQYLHRDGCAVIGGYVYRRADIPLINGRYIYGDYCTARIWTLHAPPRPGERPVELTTRLGRRLPGITTFGEDGTGRLFVSTGDAVLRFER
jgi:glucose/arabinose dehydrogenase